MLFDKSEVLREINALSSGDDGNLVSIKELLNRLASNLTTHGVVFLTLMNSKLREKLRIYLTVLEDGEETKMVQRYVLVR